MTQIKCGSEPAREGDCTDHTETTGKKKPRSSRDRIEAEGTVEELPWEGDQTLVKQAGSSVPTLSAGK